jgi:hypothetical protein
MQVNINLVLNGTVALKQLANITIKTTPPHKYTINGGRFQCFSVVESGATIESTRVANCNNTNSDFGGAFCQYLQGCAPGVEPGLGAIALGVDTASDYAQQGSGWYVRHSGLIRGSAPGGEDPAERGSDRRPGGWKPRMGGARCYKHYEPDGRGAEGRSG